MISNPAAVLETQSRSLLDLLETNGPDTAIADAVDERERLIFVLAEALGRGFTFDATQAKTIADLDARIISLLAERRNELSRELSKIHETRIARSAYSATSEENACYMDKAA
jgi:hypothetical protein